MTSLEEHEMECGGGKNDNDTYFRNTKESNGRGPAGIRTWFQVDLLEDCRKCVNGQAGKPMTLAQTTYLLCLLTHLSGEGTDAPNFSPLPRIL